jgi:rubrerythrin
MINSERYLREAFSVEDLVKKSYLFFAREAEQEGYPEIAKLFRATAQGDQVKSLTCSSRSRESQYQG